MMILRLLAILVLMVPSAPALARNIVLTNDDGLTSNTHALYHALKKQGYDVIVSVPCHDQSGTGAAITFMQPLGPLAADCHNGAAKAGEPGAGPMTRSGYDKDFYYVDGTPVMAMLYGVDVLAAQRWGKAPDLVLSGPNEGQNVGYVVLSSGTVSNAQWAAVRGIPAIALSAGLNTVDNAQLANPKSAVVAGHTVDLIRSLDERADDNKGAMLPPGIILNVNFPNELDGAEWRLSRIGTYNAFHLSFTDDIAKSASPEMIAAARARNITLPNLPGIAFAMNTEQPKPDQRHDESVVYRKHIAVSVLQLAYEHQPSARDWLGQHLQGFLSE